MLISLLVPPEPTSFNIIEIYHEISDIILTFKWDKSKILGTEKIIVDYYNVLITSKLQQVLYVVYSSPWNVTLDYNKNYNASITAVNCVGKSSPLLVSNIKFDNIPHSHTRTKRQSMCPVATAPVNGQIVAGGSRRDQSSTFVYQCNDGYTPSGRVIATCAADFSWSPDPVFHVCSLIVGMIKMCVALANKT